MAKRNDLSALFTDAQLAGVQEFLAGGMDIAEGNKPLTNERHVFQGTNTKDRPLVWVLENNVPQLAYFCYGHQVHTSDPACPVYTAIRVAFERHDMPVQKDYVPGIDLFTTELEAVRAARKQLTPVLATLTDMGKRLAERERALGEGENRE